MQRESLYGNINKAIVVMSAFSMWFIIKLMRSADVEYFCHISSVTSTQRDILRDVIRAA